MNITIKNFLLKNNFNKKELDFNFIYPALQEFKKMKAPTSVAYATIKLIKVVEKSIKDYEDTIKSICESLCDRDDSDKPKVDGNKYVFSRENQLEFNKKWEELLDSRVDLNIIPIKQSDLMGIKEMNIACYETLLDNGFITDDSQ